MTKYNYLKPLPLDAPDIVKWERLSIITQTPSYAHALISTYFDNNPCDVTQEKYKQKGLKTFDYWFNELCSIFNSTLIITDEFLNIIPLQYYSNTYKNDNNYIIIKEMTQIDKQHILQAFTTQLGMHWSIFPFKLDDILSAI